MTKFVHIDFHPEHCGVARIEGSLNHLRQLTARFDGMRGAGCLLLATMIAALLTVANQMADAWSNGHLIAAWMMLWVMALVGMALLPERARRASARAVAALRGARRAWAEARQREAEDEKTWNAALRDARIMADLSRAMTGIAVEDMRRHG